MSSASLQSQSDNGLEKSILPNIRLFGLLVGIAVLFSFVGGYECRYLASNFEDDENVLPYNLDKLKSDVIDELNAENSAEESRLFARAFQDRSSFLRVDPLLVRQQFEDAFAKPKRIDKMKFFGGIGKRSMDRSISKKSKAIDKMRFMSNIGK